MNQIASAALWAIMVPALLNTPRLVLRQVRDEDARETAALMSASIAAMLTSWPDPMTIEEASKRIRESRAETKIGAWVDWAILSRVDGRLLGWIGLGKAEPQDRIARAGIWLGEAHQGQGFGSEAVAAILPQRRAFKARAIEALIYPENHRSLALFSRQGFAPTQVEMLWSPVRGTNEPAERWVLEFGEDQPF